MTVQEALFNYCLRLADNNLILGHRLSQWCGHAPIMEEDLAMANISLDLLGQASALLQYAAQVGDAGKTEDDLAFLRNEREFRNTLLSELPNGDFALTIVRQFLVDTFDYYLYDALKSSADTTLAALAVKGHKEVTYHLRHTTSWLERLGDGTDESHARTRTAVDDLWSYTGELFEMDETDAVLITAGIAADLNEIRPKWEAHVREAFERATLRMPENAWMHSGSRQGRHTEHLGLLLAEMQYLHRAYPGVQW